MPAVFLHAFAASKDARNAALLWIRPLIAQPLDIHNFTEVKQGNGSAAGT